MWQSELNRRELLQGIGAVGLLGVAGLLRPGSEAAAQQQVSLRLDFLPSGEYCGYYTAKERGYWARNGLDVEIKAGTGSWSPASSSPWAARTSPSPTPAR